MKLVMVGVGHVFDIGRRVENIIYENAPKAVCLELDEKRFYMLMHRDELDYIEGSLPYRMLARFQQKIAEEYGSDVGSEMIAAVRAAKVVNAKIIFIDIDAEDVFIRLSKEMKFVEKVKLLMSAILGLIASKKRVEKELREYEDDTEGYIERFEHQFPTLKRVLIDERNKHMADKIMSVMKEYERVVVVIGDGHINGVKKHLNLRDVDFEIIRLKDLRVKEDIVIKTKDAIYTFTFK